MKRYLLLALFLPSLALADTRELPYGKAATISFPLYKLDGTALRTDAAHASGDSTISCDQGAFGNTTNGFVDEGPAYSITLTAAELSCEDVELCFVDQSGPQVWLDTCITISTRLTAPTGTAQAGSSSTITLASTASASNDFYKEYAVLIVSGTGAEQVRCGSGGYVGSTKVLTIGPRNWDTTPDNTSKYVLIADPGCAASAASVWASTSSELSACPTASATAQQKIDYLFEVARHKVAQTSTTQTIYKDDGSTSLCASTVSDAGGTFTRGEYQ